MTGRPDATGRRTMPHGRPGPRTPSAASICFIVRIFGELGCLLWAGIITAQCMRGAEASAVREVEARGWRPGGAGPQRRRSLTRRPQPCVRYEASVVTGIYVAVKGKDTLDEGIRHLGVLKAVVVEQKDTSKRALQQDPLSLSLSECSQGRPAPCPREDSCIERAKSRTATLSPRRSSTVDLQGPTRGGTVSCYGGCPGGVTGLSNTVSR